jgi:membrane-associated phospholipid phosphatase
MPIEGFITNPRAEMTTPGIQGNPSGNGAPRTGRWHGLTVAALLLLVLQPISAAGQSAGVVQPEQAAIRWWHGAIVLGGLSGLMLLDNPVQELSQKNRGTSGNELARGLRHFGQPEVYGPIALGLLGAGLVSGDDDVTRAGGRLALTLALAGAASGAIKWALGRPRPSESSDADGYVPLSGQEAMPSGHTTMAFALATALADDIHRTWASVGLYTLAAGVGWSRINDNRHWLSDVAAGAVLGITTAKVVSGRWRIFNFRPPSVLIGPRQATLSWQVAF